MQPEISVAQIKIRSELLLSWKQTRQTTNQGVSDLGLRCLQL